MASYDVLVIGGGFGGAFAARELERLLTHGRVLLVSPDNFLLSSPLLPEAASGTIEPPHAVIPLRELLDDTDLLIGRIEDLDIGSRRATARDVNGDLRRIDYKVAIVSPGSIPATVSIPGLTQNAVGFKTLADAIWLRNRVLHQLDAAIDPGERRRLLTFTFVGGGYAGVEAAAELESLSRDAAKRHRNIAPDDFRWVIVEAQDSLLPGLDARLARFTAGVLRRRAIEVHTETRLESCVNGLVVLSRESVAPFESGTIVWTAGQRPNPRAGQWGLPVDGTGAVPVDDHMRVGGDPNLFAIGDVAAAPAPEGGMAPNTAQHAVRQGRVAGRNAAAALGATTPAPFMYRNPSSPTSI